MADFLNIQITGINKLMSKFSNLKSEVEDVMSEELEVSAENIENESKQNCPDMVKVADSKNGGSVNEQDLAGGLRASIMAVNVSDLQKQVVVGQSPMGAYVEFGTGAYVDILPGLEDYAMTFYVNGKGTILPQPYLFPAMEDERPKLVSRLQNRFKNL